MKFGKRLKKQIEGTIPEWRDKFLSYKDLKKLIKLTSNSRKTESIFARLLISEIEKFNSFFLEQEEEFIIRQRELQDRIVKVRERFEPLDVKYTAEMLKIRKDIVNFHGEMVLLLNYSSVNYTGLAKILKKHDKHTGRILRLPFIPKILKQPFFTTELISNLIKECEILTNNILGHTESATEDPTETERFSTEKHSIFRNTISALVTMQELRKGSSSFGPHSLPPLDFSGFDFPVQSLSDFPGFEFPVQSLSEFPGFEFPVLSVPVPATIPIQF